MQEIIDYAKLTFKLFLTPKMIVIPLMLLGVYAFYLFACERVQINVSVFLKLITYPFIFSYGLLMVFVASLLEKDTIKGLGVLIMCIPIIISFSASIIKSRFYSER